MLAFIVFYGSDAGGAWAGRLESLFPRFCCDVSRETTRNAFDFVGLFFLLRFDSLVKFACGVLPWKRNEKQIYP
jgi:hypothetical protein